MSAPLRIGAVPFLNGRPLTAWFAQPECHDSVELVTDVPSRLAVLLDHGELDVAMVSSIEAFRNPRILVLPGISISADGPVWSVKVFSNVPFASIRTLATDSSSLTSAALARILLQERYGIAPNCMAMQPDPARMLDDCDAALLIGDRALMGFDARFVMDLGEAWREQTGLPFVYAMWMIVEASVASAAAEVLTRAKDWGVAHRHAIAAQWSAKTGMPERLATEYLMGIMRYDLDMKERAAMTRFVELCVAHGIVREPCPLRYADPAT